MRDVRDWRVRPWPDDRNQVDAGGRSRAAAILISNEWSWP